MRDTELQNRIDKAYLKFEGLANRRRALKPGPQRDEASKAVEAAWGVVEGLLKQRSPSIVRRMEQQQGLSRST